MDFGYSMPGVAPLYMAPPYLYRGNRSINILFRTTPETLRALVPEPLAPNPDGLLFIYIGRFSVASPVSYGYLEAGIGVPATFGDAAGQYAVYLYLDQAAAIVPGREIYGWPKKDAEIHFTEADGAISAQVLRDGVLLVDASLHLSERIDPIPPQPAAPWFNLKIIPSVKRNARPEVMQLTSTLIESEPKELYTGSAALKFGSSAFDPLGDIPILEILDGSFTVDDIVLGYGDVIHDYLTESGME